MFFIDSQERERHGTCEFPFLSDVDGVRFQNFLLIGDKRRGTKLSTPFILMLMKFYNCWCSP